MGVGWGQGEEHLREKHLLHQCHVRWEPEAKVTQSSRWENCIPPLSLLTVPVLRLRTCTHAPSRGSREVHTKAEGWRVLFLASPKASICREWTPGLLPKANPNHKWSTRWALGSHLFQTLTWYVRVLWAKFKLTARRLWQFAESLYPSCSCTIFSLHPGAGTLGLELFFFFQFGNCSISSPAGLRSGGESGRGQGEPPERLRLARSPRWGWQVREGPDLFCYPLCQPSVLINVHRFMGF